MIHTESTKKLRLSFVLKENKTDADQTISQNVCSTCTLTAAGQ